MLHETLKWQLTSTGSTNNTTASIEAFAVSMDAVLGDYECDAYGKLTITKNNGQYLLKMEFHPELEGALSPSGKNQLLCTYNHPMFGKMKLPFIINENKVESFTLYVDGFVENDGHKFMKIHPSP
ncbi:hypothetical protein [Flavihumibacter sp. UBA7668]|uniref:hypothetical protein n=1 Tax=Flavihumibacter sp. UBA7668 TaxID=1946542 RepID=UPI0025BEC262|nr:hypothetical protein [Flavihumibacter sp. UBA7668]